LTILAIIKLIIQRLDLMEYTIISESRKMKRPSHIFSHCFAVKDPKYVVGMDLGFWMLG